MDNGVPATRSRSNAGGSIATIYYKWLDSDIAVFYKNNKSIYQMNLLCIKSNKMSSCEPIDICNVCASTPARMLVQLQQIL